MKIAKLLALALFLCSLLTPPALADGVTLGQEQQRARDQMNQIRKKVGLPPVSLSTGLNKAAYGHSRYVLETLEYGHYETAKSSPYFVGYAPKDRAATYSYFNSSITENYYMNSLGAVGTRTYLPVDNAVDWWMSAIYHRFPIVSPRTEHVGYGPYYKAGRAAQVLDFGTDYNLSGPLTRWPLSGQTGVGTRLDGESPSPIAKFAGATFPTGYPVSMTWYQYGKSLVPTSMTVVRAADGLNIEGYKLSPANDQFHQWSTSLSFIPKKPLAYNTKYTVTFKGTFAGAPFSYAWSFTTMPAPGRLVSSVPSNGATGVARAPEVSLSFSQPIRTYSLVRTFYKNGLDSNGIGISLARASDGVELGMSIQRPTAVHARVVKFTPSVALAANTRYRVAFTLADAWGRPYRGTVYFTTGP